MKTGGRRLAERWLWRKSVVGSWCVDGLNLEDRKMRVVSEIRMRSEVKAMTRQKIAILLGLIL